MQGGQACGPVLLDLLQAAPARPPVEIDTAGRGQTLDGGVGHVDHDDPRSREQAKTHPCREFQPMDGGAEDPFVLHRRHRVRRQRRMDRASTAHTRRPGVTLVLVSLAVPAVGGLLDPTRRARRPRVLPRRVAGEDRRPLGLAFAGALAVRAVAGRFPHARGRGQVQPPPGREPLVVVDGPHSFPSQPLVRCASSMQTSRHGANRSPYTPAWASRIVPSD